jgi:class 3 adenylate cyclase
LGAKQDELTSRGLETADRIRGKIQSTLETAVEKAAAAQRKRYTILVAIAIVGDSDQQAGPETMQKANHDLYSIIAEHRGEIAQLTDYGFVALFETPSGDKEAPLQAIAAGRELLAAAPAIQTALPHFKLRLGIHTGILATHELDGEAIETAKAVANAAPFGQLYLSHATYRLVLWQIKSEKRETIETPTEKSLQLHTLT